jgi:hypothetical protein
MTERPIRFEIERPVEFRLTDVRGGPRFQGRTTNISSGGVLFRTDQMLAVGRKIEMIVRMSESPEESLDVDLRLLGRIVRSGPGWAAAQVRKHQILPTGPPGTRRDMDNTLGRPDGL